MKVQLSLNWRKIATAAWSMRLIYLAVLVSVAEIALVLYSPKQLGLWLPVAVLVVNLGAALARIIDQPGLRPKE